MFQVARQREKLNPLLYAIGMDEPRKKILDVALAAEEKYRSALAGEGNGQLDRELGR
jgi:hypothetical protein